MRRRDWDHQMNDTRASFLHKRWLHVELILFSCCRCCCCDDEMWESEWERIEAYKQHSKKQHQRQTVSNSKWIRHKLVCAGITDVDFLFTFHIELFSRGVNFVESFANTTSNFMLDSIQSKHTTHWAQATAHAHAYLHYFDKIDRVLGRRMFTPWRLKLSTELIVIHNIIDLATLYRHRT